MPFSSMPSQFKRLPVTEAHEIKGKNTCSAPYSCTSSRSRANSRIVHATQGAHECETNKLLSSSLPVIVSPLPVFSSCLIQHTEPDETRDSAVSTVKQLKSCYDRVDCHRPSFQIPALFTSWTSLQAVLRQTVAPTTSSLHMSSNVVSFRMCSDPMDMLAMFSTEPERQTSSHQQYTTTAVRSTAIRATAVKQQELVACTSSSSDTVQESTRGSPQPVMSQPRLAGYVAARSDTSGWVSNSIRPKNYPSVTLTRSKSSSGVEDVCIEDGEAAQSQRKPSGRQSIEKRIQTAQNILQLQALVLEHDMNLSPQQVAMAFSRFAELYQTRNGNRSMRRPGRCLCLQHLTSVAMALICEFELPELADVLQACAKLGYRYLPLLDELSDRAAVLVPTASPSQLARAVSGLAVFRVDSSLHWAVADLAAESLASSAASAQQGGDVLPGSSNGLTVGGLTSEVGIASVQQHSHESHAPQIVSSTSTAAGPGKHNLENTGSTIHVVQSMAHEEAAHEREASRGHTSESAEQQYDDVSIPDDAIFLDGIRPERRKMASLRQTSTFYINGHPLHETGTDRHAHNMCHGTEALSNGLLEQLSLPFAQSASAGAESAASVAESASTNRGLGSAVHMTALGMDSVPSHADTDRNDGDKNNIIRGLVADTSRGSSSDNKEREKQRSGNKGLDGVSNADSAAPCQSWWVGSADRDRPSKRQRQWPMQERETERLPIHDTYYSHSSHHSRGGVSQGQQFSAANSSEGQNQTVNGSTSNHYYHVNGALNQNIRQNSSVVFRSDTETAATASQHTEYNTRRGGQPMEAATKFNISEHRNSVIHPDPQASVSGTSQGNHAGDHNADSNGGSSTKDRSEARHREEENSSFLFPWFKPAARVGSRPPLSVQVHHSQGTSISNHVGPTGDDSSESDSAPESDVYRPRWRVDTDPDSIVISHPSETNNTTSSLRQLLQLCKSPSLCNGASTTMTSCSNYPNSDPNSGGENLAAGRVDVVAGSTVVTNGVSSSTASSIEQTTVLLNNSGVTQKANSYIRTVDRSSGQVFSHTCDDLEEEVDLITTSYSSFGGNSRGSTHSSSRDNSATSQEEVSNICSAPERFQQDEGDSVSCYSRENGTVSTAANEGEHTSTRNGSHGTVSTSAHESTVDACRVNSSNCINSSSSSSSSNDSSSVQRGTTPHGFAWQSSLHSSHPSPERCVESRMPAFAMNSSSSGGTSRHLNGVASHSAHVSSTRGSPDYLPSSPTNYHNTLLHHASSTAGCSIPVTSTSNAPSSTPGTSSSSSGTSSSTPGTSSSTPGTSSSTSGTSSSTSGTSSSTSGTSNGTSGTTSSTFSITSSMQGAASSTSGTTSSTGSTSLTVTNIASWHGNDVAEVLWAFARIRHPGGVKVLEWLESMLGGTWNRVWREACVGAVTKLLWSFSAAGWQLPAGLSQQLLGRLEESAGEVSSLQLSQIMYSASTAGPSLFSQRPSCLTALLSHLPSLLATCKPSELSQILLGLGRLKQKPRGEILEALITAAVPALTQLDPLEVQRVEYGLYLIRYNPSFLLVRALPYWTTQHATHPWTPHDLSHMTYCMVRFSWHSRSQRHMQQMQEFLHHMCDHAVEQIGEQTAVSLSGLLWAMAKLKMRHRGLLGLLPEQLVPRLPDLDSRRLAHIAWSCAALSLPSRYLLSPITRLLHARSHKLNPVIPISLGFSLARLGVLDTSTADWILSLSLRTHAGSRLRAKHLAHLAYMIAKSKMAVQSGELYRLGNLAAKKMRHFTATTMACMLWMYARLQYRHEHFLAQSCVWMQQNMRSLGLRQAEVVLGAYSRLAYNNPVLLVELVEHLNYLKESQVATAE